MWKIWSQDRLRSALFADLCQLDCLRLWQEQQFPENNKQVHGRSRDSQLQKLKNPWIDHHCEDVVTNMSCWRFECWARAKIQPSSQGLQTTLCRLPTWGKSLQVSKIDLMKSTIINRVLLLQLLVHPQITRNCFCQNDLFNVDTVSAKSSFTEFTVVARLDKSSALTTTLHLL